jgi:dihydroxy-acid dehydratase
MENPKKRFRSRNWFDDPARVDMVALYLERWMNSGFTPAEFRSGRPIIGIAQSGSDLTPCNRVHVGLAARINDPSLGIDEHSILVMRGAGPLGWPGSAEVVNMQPPDALLKKGITRLPTIGDGRQSGTSDSPSILNASPESAAGGGLSWLRTDDTIRIDVEKGCCDALVSEEEIARRKKEAPPPIPESQSPWQELSRATTGRLDTGAVMEMAVKYRGIASKTSRHNH